MRTTTGGITISTIGSKLAVESPYHTAFIAVARNRQGKWKEPHWLFDPRDEAGIREELIRIYGTDGTPAECVDVRVELDVLGSYRSGTVWYGLGRKLVERKARDYSVRLGDGVVVIAGGFGGSGGSVKNPRPDPRNGTVLEVRDVPLDLARAFEAEFEGVTIVSTPQTEPEPQPEPQPEPEPQPGAPPLDLAAVLDPDLIAELERRGYQVTRP